MRVSALGPLCWVQSTEFGVTTTHRRISHKWSEQLVISTHCSHCTTQNGRTDAVTTVRAAAVQLSPVLYSREGTVDRVVTKIDELAKREVQFAVFPETVVPYYPY